MKIVIDNVEQIAKLISEKNSYEFTLVKFSTEWCSPCKKLQEVIKKIEIERKDVFVLEIDAEKSFQISRDPIFDVFSVPVMFLFRKGIFQKRIDGYIDLETLKKLLI